MRGIEALHDDAEVAASRDRGELVGVQTVHRDVDAADAGVSQFVREAGELRPVGGQRQLLQRAGLEMARETADEAHQVAPDQRLAARQPNLARAAAHERRA